MIKKSKNFLTKYLFYYLKKNEKINKTKLIEGSAIPVINALPLKSLKVNLPILEIQKQIIDIIEPLENINFYLNQQILLLTKKLKFIKNKIFESIKNNKNTLCYKLGEILFVEFNCKNKIANIFIDPDSIRKNITKNYKNQLASFCSNNSIAFVKDGSVGVNVFLEKESMIASTMICLRAKEKITTKYLYYWINKNINKILKLKSGSVIAHIYYSKLSKLKIFLPSLEI